MTAEDIALQRWFGRWEDPDPRDEDFLLGAVLEAEGLDEPPLPGYKYWRTGEILDQGATSRCVGYSWKQFQLSSPLRTKSGPAADKIYWEAQNNYDSWPGAEPKYYGTSTRAGVKYLQALGYIESYGWTKDLETALRWLAFKGILVIGIDWREGMSYPSVNNDYILSVSGEKEGGHCTCLTGFNLSKRLLQLTNSWGEGWAKKGKAYLPFSAYEELMGSGGETCTAIEQKLVTAPLPVAA